MGEVVLSSDGLEKSEAEKANSRAEVSTATKSDAMTRWEKFLPTMMVRVLLVEADDSTRQIIAALLRKCSYRVAAVSDGLKAWELLKGRPHNVDLILTEVDLPSISGFPLLTLIMENEVCKNIPVIMMSSQDSISTVYKCMTRGAADYLVKPIRRNELSNLWQHVWRRKASNANGPQDESVAQGKVEDMSENDAASNHSNGNTACIQRNDENVDKGSDSQSSCTKPELEAESLHMEKLQEFPQPTQGKSLSSDLRIIQEDEGHANPGHTNRVDARGTTTGNFKDSDAEIALGQGLEPESCRRESSKSIEARETNNVSFNQTRDAIDLNGFVNDTPNFGYQNSLSSNVTSKFEYAPTLDLTLRSSSGGFENQIAEKRPALGRSNSSAFSRYINRPLHPLNQTSASAFDQEKECGTKTENHMSNVIPGLGYNSDTTKSVLTLATGQSNHSEVANYCPQQRVYPLPIPVKGIRINNPSAGYNSSSGPSAFCSQSGSSSMAGPSSIAHQESPFYMFYQTNPDKNKSEQLFEPLCRNANVAMDHEAMHNREHKLDSFEDRGHISPATDQSASSSFCNGNASQFTSIGYGSACGSNSNVDQVAMVRTGAENRIEETYFTSNGNSHRSIQREAALTKFRMKRKDRCFDKKVRYESRKKLAEQRPRVKGQFVRQVQTDPSLLVTDGDS